MTGVATDRALQRLARPLRLARRRRAGSRSALGAAALAPRCRRPGRSGSGWIDGAVLGAGRVARRRSWRSAWWRGSPGDAIGALSHWRVARRLEELGAWRRGTLTALLDQPARGTSDALLALADAAQAERGRAPRRRGGRAARAAGPRRSASRVSACSLVGLRRVRVGRAGCAGAAAALWHPARAWERLWRRCGSRADRERGGPGRLGRRSELEAIGRRTATLWLRAPGEEWQPRGVRLDSLGQATVSSGPLEQRLFARVTSGSRASDTRAGAGAAAGVPRAAHRHRALSRLPRSRGRAGADRRRHAAAARRHPARDPGRGHGAAVARAAWETGPAKRAADGERRARSRGSFVPPASGEYRLALATRERRAAGRRHGPPAGPRRGRQRAGGRDPGARRRHPGAAEPQVPLVVDVRDDHGITAVAVVSRRISRLGTVGLGRARDARRSRPARPTAPSSPTRSTSTAAGCCPATRSATSPSPRTTRRSGRAAARASSCSGCRR